MSVEVSVRGEHGALGSATCRNCTGENQPCMGEKNRQKAGRGTALAQEEEQEKGQAGWRLGEESREHGEGFLWAEEFSSRQAQGEQLARGKHREE